MSDICQNIDAICERINQTLDQREAIFAQMDKDFAEFQEAMKKARAA